MKPKIDYKKLRKGDIVFYYERFEIAKIRRLSFLCVHPFDKELLIFLNTADSRKVEMLTIYEFIYNVEFIARDIKDLFPLLEKFHKEDKKYYLKVLNKKSG